jgi:molybdate transport system regulatory protein
MINNIRMGETTKFKLNGSLWIEVAEGPVIGPGRVELLERIGLCGSIRQAAMQMKMSYRQAWMLVDHMNTHLDSPVIISHRGGKGGGYAEVTEKGRKVIEQFHLFYEKFQAFLAENSGTINL